MMNCYFIAGKFQVNPKPLSYNDEASKVLVERNKESLGGEA
jgi:hypothetical protein